jgi:Protein of unknown function (DUF3223)
MPRKPLLVGSRVFPFKRDAEDACRKILYRSQSGGRVVVPADVQFLLDLLELHPEREIKIGVGIAHFEVRSNPRFGKQRSFYLIRTDGTETDFSFVKCLRPPTHRQLVMAAMRREVEGQIIEFAKHEYRVSSHVLCPITRRYVERDAAHVDHSSPTFLELAEDFAGRSGGWYELSVAHADGSIGVQLGSSHQAGAWRKYHRERANLRIVSIEANLSLLRRSGELPGEDR